ncbi:hypothetical protein [Xanthobacter agilis]|uniref:Uncharacterized protein n=1 Tax=Xanthobacter agilis TaxID=47492 RepID=A0ABU0LFS0_XANAG|nr:hypothetical protein [Xanthobacter agilis]MDQ0505990.1 hypothetical protein [Xanthobacter agilis]
MTFLSDIIARMAIALCLGGVDLDAESDVMDFLRSCGFSPDEVAAGWEEACADALEIGQITDAVSGLEAA